MLLNPTAAFIFQHPDPPAYAHRFGVSLTQARSDIAQTLPAFHLSAQPPSASSPPVVPLNSPTPLTIRIASTTFQLHLTTADQLAELAPRLSALQVESSATPSHIFHLVDHAAGTTVFRDHHAIGTEPYVTGARALLLQEITRLAVPSRDFTAILHAGAIGTSEACLILAGASLSGKSTLCAALSQSGLLCYSDDSVCLTRSYHVAGMPFALALRETPRFRPSNLNGTSPTARPAALLFVSYQPSALPADLQPLTTFDALLELEHSGFWIEHTQHATAAFIDWLASIPRFKLTYSHLSTAMQTLQALLSDNF